MPVCFWNDLDGAKYRKASFDTFPGGVRIGTAEIYRQVESLSEVLEAIAVGQEWQGDVRVVLFVRLGRA